MAITSRLVDFQQGDDAFDGYLAWDDSVEGPRPGVMICHAWAGRGDHEEAAARQLAALGYVAFATDVYGKGKRGTTIEENEALMTPLAENRELLQSRLRAGLSTLAGQAEADGEKLAVSGYCFGGLCALDMACANAPVLGVAAFHAVLGNSWHPVKDPVLPKVIAFQGYDDPMADKDAQRQFADEMTGRKADWQLHLFGGVSHAFTNTDADKPDMGLKYNAAAASRAWAGFERFLEDLF